MDEEKQVFELLVSSLLDLSRRMIVPSLLRARVVRSGA